MQADLIEKISAAVHDAWMEAKKARGITSQADKTSGEELIVPYEQLSEQAKDLDRGSVKAVLAGIEAAGLVIGPWPPPPQEPWFGIVEPKTALPKTVIYEDGDLNKPVPYEPAE